MEYNKNLFPAVRKSIADFLYEEEANISRSRMLSLGSLMVLVGVLLMHDDVFAAHRSHSSHSSHASHASHTSSTVSSGGSSYTAPAAVTTPKPVPTSTPTPTPTPPPSLPPIQTPQIPQDTPVIG